MVWVAPPETGSSEDLFARDFSDWMVGRWLQDYYWDGSRYTEYPGRNVLVYSYWNILTGEKPSEGRASDRLHNHHRLNPFRGSAEYSGPGSPGFVDTQQAWWDGDSHPPDFAGAFGTKELINRLAAAWNLMHQNLPTARPAYPADGRLAYFPLHDTGNSLPVGVTENVVDGVACTVLNNAAEWDLGDIDHPEGSLSVAFWYRPGPLTIPASEENKAIVAAGDLATVIHTSLAARDSSFVETALGAGGLLPGGEDAINNVADADTWTHVSVTYDAATEQVRQYVDAVQIIETQTLGGLGSLPGGSHAVVIGPGGGNNFALRDLVFYSRALTPAEVQDIFLAAWPGLAPQPAPSPAIRFTTRGSSFAPVIVVTGTPEILWTFADGSTSSSTHPVNDFGSAGTRVHSLQVTPWSALQRVNIGYDGGDGGSWLIEHVPDQHVSAVSGLELVAPTLGQWCSSYNLIPELDFSNFTHLDTIECFLSGSLTRVHLGNTPNLRRACFEDCSLASLDLSQSPMLEDLRGAANNYPTINFGSIGAQTWHICIRDNPQFTDQALFADMAQFPNISELFIWNDNQAGTLRIPASSPTNWVSILADGNHYSSLDLAGALQNGSAGATVTLRNNQLASIDITGCDQITELYLENNALSAAALDALLATLDALGRNKAPTDLSTVLEVNIQGNETPSAAGYASAQNLSAKGWRVIAEGWTLEPAPPPDTGEARLDFTTTGDATSMQCEFWGASTTATWHWSDGTTSPAASGATQAKTGLGAGTHAHYLIISNGSALTRFGAASGGGQGHLAAMDSLNNCPLLDVLYAYNEGSLASLSRTHQTRLREFHLMGTELDAAAMDQVFADAAATGVSGGTMWCPNAGTAASDADRATLAARGWSLNY